MEDVFSLARHGHHDAVSALFDRGLPVDVRDAHGNTVLAVACQNGQRRVAKAALRRGADLNAQNRKGNTPLHFCYAFGYGDTLGAYLISKGADEAVRNAAGLLPHEGLG